MRMTVQVTLPAGRSEVWAAVSTIRGSNRELAPFVRLTDPTGGAPFDTEPWRGGARVSWQLLFGFIPVDRHRVDLVALPDGQGFRESSSTWWHRVWWHERTLLDAPGGCVVRDSVEMEPRLGVPAPIVGWAVRRMFHQRHRSLQRRFG
jgi:ligand-binding SRPBCC domain-containing protein